MPLVFTPMTVLASAFCLILINLFEVNIQLAHYKDIAGVSFNANYKIIYSVPYFFEITYILWFVITIIFMHLDYRKISSQKTNT